MIYDSETYSINKGNKKENHQNREGKKYRKRYHKNAREQHKLQCQQNTTTMRSINKSDSMQNWGDMLTCDENWPDINQIG